MYPYCILDSETQQNIFPLFGKEKLNPLFLPFSDNSDWFMNLDNETQKNQKKFQKALENYKSNNKNLIISGYLEKREHMFRTLGCQQMVQEKRFFHLGIDLCRPKNSPIFTPLDGKVINAGYEKGEGNYGGFIVLQHEINRIIFFTVYGHLNPQKLPIKGKNLKAGQLLAFLGDFHQNGNYFHHLHFQVLSQKGFENGFISKGYCTTQQLETIEEYCPNPGFLIRY